MFHVWNFKGFSASSANTSVDISNQTYVLYNIGSKNNKEIRYSVN